MRRRDRSVGPAALLVGLAALAGWGVLQVLSLRLEEGSLYPPYSSLRSDPLGAEVLYEALAALPGVRVARSFVPPERATLPADAALLFLGLDVSALEAEPLPGGPPARVGQLALEAFAAAGGRLVLALAPEAGATDGRGGAPPEPPGGKRSLPPEEGRPEPEPATPPGSLAARWGLRLGRWPLEQGATARATSPRAGAPESVSWHSEVFFERPLPPWSVSYARQGRAVAVERPWGRGTLVLFSDSYLFSNEAMWKERRPALLASVLGARRWVVFDERHLGVGENPGVAWLVREYRLTGLVAGLALLGVLFVWKSAAPLGRRGSDEAPAPGAEGGRDSQSALAGLLRRSIRPEEIFATCVREWTASCSPPRGRPAAPAQPAAEIPEDLARRDPAAAYRKMALLLAQTRRRGR